MGHFSPDGAASHFFVTLLLGCVWKLYTVQYDTSGLQVNISSPSPPPLLPSYIMLVHRNLRYVFVALASETLSIARKVAEYTVVSSTVSTLSIM
jgi:hypothetical protein